MPTTAIAFRVAVAVAAAIPSAGAQWTAQSSGTRASLRGLSVVNDNVVWASGSRATILRTTDGGTTWTADTIPGAGRFDVRAIHARSALVAHADAWMAVEGAKDPARMCSMLVPGRWGEG